MAPLFSRQSWIVPRTAGFAILFLLFSLPTAAGPLEVMARHGIQPTEVGYVIVDPRDGRTIASHRPDTAFIPASVAKVPSMVAALAILGPDHRFTTTVLGSGSLKDGVLDGDVILQGGGDPTLDSRALTELVQALVGAGVRRVSGRFLYDASALPALAEIDSGQPFGAGYNTGVNALSVNFNRAYATWVRREGRVTARAWSVSDAGRLPLDGVTLTADSAGSGTLSPLPASAGEGWRFKPPGKDGEGAFWMPIRHPDAATAGLFQRIAAGSGLALPTPQPGSPPAGAWILARHDSAPLNAVVAGVLRYSNNLSAELIGLAAARRLNPKTDSLAKAGAVLAEWLRSRTAATRANTDWTGFTLANASGLTAISRMTPRQAAAVLRLGGESLFALLPGEDEGKATPGARAKSGTMAYAKGLAGVFTGASGRRLIFALFVGDDARRRGLDTAMDRSSPDMPAEARAWLAHVRAFQGELLAQWVNSY